MHYFQALKILLFTFVITVLSFRVCSIKVDPDTSLFVDQYNRFRIYHGVNAVFKTAPFYPDTQQFSSNFSLTDTDLYNLRNWGMNVIRLHIAWQGVQPKKGVYNYTYIQKIRDIVRMCNKKQIMVLLDSHQDLFNKQFCGEGFPDWTVKRQSFPFPLKVKIRYDDQGYPFRQDCLSIPFSVFYTTKDLMKLQQDFFTDQRGLLTHFIKMWEIVAAFMVQQPNIIGYEFLNQPIGSNFYRSPADTLLPGVSNNKFLLPAYKRWYEAIRKIDRRTILFFQPSVIDALSEGFFDTPGGQKQLERQVFSYHIYCPYVTSLGEPVSTQFCAKFDLLEVGSKQANVLKMKVGGFMTQYGALSNSVKSAKQITILTDLMQLYFRSWTYWQFKYFNDITTMANPGTTQSFYDEYGKLQQNKIKALARPYAYAICGTPIKQTLKNGTYFLKWFSNKNCYNKNTQLFLSENYYYQVGFTVKFSKTCSKCQIQRITTRQEPSTFNFFQIILDADSYNKTLTITISQKGSQHEQRFQELNQIGSQKINQEVIQE